MHQLSLNSYCNLTNVIGFLSGNAIGLAQSGKHGMADIAALILKKSGLTQNCAIPKRIPLGKTAGLIDAVVKPRQFAVLRKSSKYLKHNPTNPKWFNKDRFLGLDKAVIGINKFGLSAPAEQAFNYLGLTVENVFIKLEQLL